MEFVDSSLARRFETAEATACQNCAKAFHRQHPDFPMAVEEIAGGSAVFAGVDSPVTQAIGVGLQGEVADSELDHLQEFFHSRGAAAAVELCPLVEMSLYERFAKRGFQLFEVSDVLFRRLSAEDNKPDAVRTAVAVRRAAPEEAKLWTKTVAQGFAEHFPVTQSMLDVMEGFFTAACCFIALVNGVVAGGGAVSAKPRSVRPFRREHAARISPARRSDCFAVRSSGLGRRAGMRPSGKHRAAGKRLPPQYRAPRVPDRLYANQTDPRSFIARKMGLPPGEVELQKAP
jgi:hypothetical protein